MGLDEGHARRCLILPLVLCNTEQTSSQMDGRPVQKHSYVILMLPKLSSNSKPSSNELTCALDHVFHIKVYYTDITLCILYLSLSVSVYLALQFSASIQSLHNSYFLHNNFVPAGLSIKSVLQEKERLVNKMCGLSSETVRVARSA